MTMTDARTRGSLVAAALVGAFLLAQTILGSLANAVYTFAQGQSFVGTPVSWTALDVVFRILPVAIGVFLVFWRVLAPVTEQLALPAVLVRSLVAAAAGSLLALVAGGIYGFVTSFSGSLFGNSFPFRDVASAFGTVSNYTISAVTGFVGLVPLVALAAVLLWLWLRRRSA